MLLPPRHRAAALTACFAVGTTLFFPHSVAAAEPVYRVTLPDGSALRATLEVGSAPDGGRWARVRMGAGRGAPGRSVEARLVDTTLFLDAAGRAVRCRTEARSPEGWVSLLEVERGPEPGRGGLTVRIPEQTGTMAAGAPLVSALDALAFLGRRYDWKRGGPQNFALLIDFLPQPPRLVTMTLEAAGTETLDFPDAEVRARKLKITTDLPGRAPGAEPDVLYVGPAGEVLRSRGALFPLPFEAEGPARVEKNGLTLRLVRPAPLVVRAARRPAASGNNGLTVKIETLNGMEIGSVSTDAAYHPVHIAHEFLGRPFTADSTPAGVRWRLAAGRREPVSVTGEPWFLPLYLATEFWESAPAAAQVFPGAKRTATYLPLELGSANGLPFDIENRGADTVTGPEGLSVTLRHWRHTFAGRAQDLWTDGARLVKLAASDGLMIVREGWAERTAGLKAPAAPSGRESEPEPPPAPNEPPSEPSEPPPPPGP